MSAILVAIFVQTIFRSFYNFCTECWKKKKEFQRRSSNAKSSKQIFLKTKPDRKASNEICEVYADLYCVSSSNFHSPCIPRRSVPHSENRTLCPRRHDTIPWSRRILQENRKKRNIDYALWFHLHNMYITWTCNVSGSRCSPRGG